MGDHGVDPLDATAIVRLEQAKRSVRIEEAVAIAAVFSMDLSSLLMAELPVFETQLLEFQQFVVETEALLAKIDADRQRAERSLQLHRDHVFYLTGLIHLRDCGWNADQVEFTLPVLADAIRDDAFLNFRFRRDLQLGGAPESFIERLAQALQAGEDGQSQTS